MQQKSVLVSVHGVQPVPQLSLIVSHTLNTCTELLVASYKLLAFY